MYDKTHPFLASIKERYLLSHPGTQRRTYHIVLDIEGSDLKYTVGDSVGISAVNDPEIVAKTLTAMRAIGTEQVKAKNSDHAYALENFLTHRANIAQFSRKLVAEIAARQPNEEKKKHLEHLLQDASHDALKAYQEQRHLWDLLAEHSEVSFAPQELCQMLMPLLPRLYSIASAQDIVGTEIHLTVSHLLYHSNEYPREGVATSFLCRRAALHQPNIPIYIQPHHGFTVPSTPNTPLIMVGPGTGVAPFRAFMQQRLFNQDEAPCWLFFGEWNAAYDFFYEDFWRSIPHLKVSTAFSRDQAHKVYVQHRMLEHSAEIFQWIQDGAILYVCGDAHHMAKDVDQALHKIVEMHSTEDPRLFIKQLRAAKRYLRDIY
jgi:sulfite reductase (NADPH) flavoprotein alpha-component